MCSFALETPRTSERKLLPHSCQLLRDISTRPATVTSAFLRLEDQESGRPMDVRMLYD